MKIKPIDYSKSTKEHFIDGFWSYFAPLTWLKSKLTTKTMQNNYIKIKLDPELKEMLDDLQARAGLSSLQELFGRAMAVFDMCTDDKDARRSVREELDVLVKYESNEAKILILKRAIQLLNF